MDENADQKPLVIQGPLIDLYNPELPILQAKTILPNQQAFLYRLSQLKDKKTPNVLAAASRVYDFKTQGKSISFSTKSPSNTNNVMRILLPSSPQKTVATHQKQIEPTETTWDAQTHTLLLKFKNYSEGVDVHITL